MLAYHRVREAIAVELFDFIHIPGIPRVWEMLGAILFWEDDTQNCCRLKVRHHF